jgi:hypothetical protein
MGKPALLRLKPPKRSVLGLAPIPQFPYASLALPDSVDDSARQVQISGAPSSISERPARQRKNLATKSIIGPASEVQSTTPTLAVSVITLQELAQRQVPRLLFALCEPGTKPPSK